MWAEKASEARGMTGTHAGLCLFDVCSVHKVLFSTPIPFFSSSVSISLHSIPPCISPSSSPTHSLYSYLLLVPEKIGQSLCKEKRRSGEGGGCEQEEKKAFWIETSKQRENE